MNVILVIIICLLASVGIVQAIGWLIVGLYRHPEWDSTIQVMPLRNDLEELEAQLRYELFLQRWSTSPQPYHIILLDTGLSEEGKIICEKLTCKISGLEVCSPKELAKKILALNEKPNL